MVIINFTLRSKVVKVVDFGLVPVISKRFSLDGRFL